MENDRNTGGFRYTYSAKEQAELKRLREKYSEKSAPAEDKMERLRRLDRSVTSKAQTVALILGVIGTLILGIGMSLAMSEFSAVLGEWSYLSMPIGIVIGLVGGGIAGIAYPIYQWIVKRERARVAPEILRLTEELMK